MRRVGHQSIALIGVMALGLGLCSGIALAGDCVPASGCPMMRSGATGHCQPSSSFVADCCVACSLPGDQAPTPRAIVEVPRLSTTECATLSFDAIEPVMAGPVPLAAKLHSIGRHTLFQVFLS